MKTEEINLNEEVFNKQIKCETNRDDTLVFPKDGVKKEIEFISDKVKNSADAGNINKDSTNNDISKDEDKIKDHQCNTNIERQRELPDTLNYEIPDTLTNANVESFEDGKDHDIDIHIDDLDICDKHMNSINESINFNTNEAIQNEFKTKKTAKQSILNEKHPITASTLFDEPIKNCKSNNNGSEKTVIIEVDKPNEVKLKHSINIKIRKVPRKRKQTLTGENSAAKEVVKRGRKKKIKEPPKMTIASELTLLFFIIVTLLTLFTL